MSKDTDAKANEDETKSQLSSHSSESHGGGRLKIDLDEDDQPASTKNKSPTSTKIKAQPVTPVKEHEKSREKVELKRELEELNLTNFGGSQTSQDSVEKPKIKRRNDRGLDGGYWSQMAELNDSGRKRRRTNILDSSSLSTHSANDSYTTEETRAPPDIDDSESVQSKSSKRFTLFKSKTILAVRADQGSFFLCQACHTIYEDSKKCKIQWLEEIDPDQKPVQYRFGYVDWLDPSSIISKVHMHKVADSNRMTLDEQDLVKVRDLLDKAVKEGGITVEFEEQKETSPESDMVVADGPKEMSESSSAESDQIKKPKKKRASGPKLDDSDPEQKKEKKVRPSDNKQVAGSKSSIHIKKMTKTNETVVMRKSPQLNGKKKKEANGNETDELESDKEVKKVAKNESPRVKKRKLAKIVSNRSLEENDKVTVLASDPFFEQNDSMPFISPLVQSKLAFRYVNLNDEQGLRDLIGDTRKVSSVHVKKSLYCKETPSQLALTLENRKMLEILIDDFLSPKQNRVKLSDTLFNRFTNGVYNMRSLGISNIRKLTEARGVREGNQAFNKDQDAQFCQDTYRFFNDLFETLFENGCSIEMYDFLLSKYRSVSESTNPRNNFISYESRFIYENIYKAVLFGHRKLAAYLIENAPAGHGFNSVHIEVLKAENGSDLNCQLRSNQCTKKPFANDFITPIHCASINPNVKYLKTLLSITQDFDIQDKKQRRPVHYAAVCQDSTPLEYLITRVSPYQVDVDGNTPLHYACMANRSINCEILLNFAQKKQENDSVQTTEVVIDNKFGLGGVNRPNKRGLLPLHLAIQKGNYECIKVLINYGANLEYALPTSMGKITPLMYSVQMGHNKIAKFLIENNAKIEALDRFKRNAVIHAAMTGSAKILSYLLRAGSSPNVQDSSGNSPLHYACAYGWYFSAKSLVEAGANINLNNDWKLSAFGVAFLKGHIGICDYLLTLGKIDINFRTEEGESLVMLTVSSSINDNNVKQLDYIVNKLSANVKLRDLKGNNAFHYLAANASDTGLNLKMADTLVKAGCNANLNNYNLETPLYTSLSNLNVKFGRYLLKELGVKLDSKSKVLFIMAERCMEMDCCHVIFGPDYSDHDIFNKYRSHFEEMAKLKNEHGLTPFQIACTKLNTHLAQIPEHCRRFVLFLYKECKSDPNELVYHRAESVAGDELDKKAYEPVLFNFVNDKCIDLFMDLIQVNQECINFALCDSNGFNLLQKAICLGQSELSVKLLDTGGLCSSTESLKNLLLNKNENILQLCLRYAEYKVFLRVLDLIVGMQKSQADLSNSEALLKHEDKDGKNVMHYLAELSAASSLGSFLSSLRAKINLLCGNLGVMHQLCTKVDKHGRQPMHLCLLNSTDSADTLDVQFFLSEFSGFDTADSLNRLPLHYLFLSNKLCEFTEPATHQTFSQTDPVELLTVLVEKTPKHLLDCQDVFGYTPLHYAALRGATISCSILIANNCSILKENLIGNTPLSSAIYFKRESTILQLLRSENQGLRELNNYYKFGKTVSRDQGMKCSLVEQPDQTQKSIHLFELILSYKWQGINWLILGSLNSFGMTMFDAIETAIIAGDAGLALRLIEKIQRQSSDECESLLLKKSKNHFNRTLLTTISNTNIESYQNRDALFTIIDKILSLNKMDTYLTEKDDFGSTAIHYACFMLNFHLIDYIFNFLATRPNLPQPFFLLADLPDKHKQSAYSLFYWHIGRIHYTTTHLDKIKTYTDKYVSKNRQSICTACYPMDSLMAFRPQEFILGKMVLDYPRTGEPNESKKSALLFAINKQNFTMCKFLLKNLQLDCNTTDSDGVCAMAYAIKVNNFDICQLLLDANYAIDKSSSVPVHKESKTVARTKLLFSLVKNDDEESADESEQETMDDSVSEYNIQPVLKKDKVLVKSGICLDHKDLRSKTLFHHLAEPLPNAAYVNTKVRKLLINAYKSGNYQNIGDFLKRVDSSMKTALDYTIDNSNFELYDELKKLSNSTLVNGKKAFEINDSYFGKLDTKAKPDFKSDSEKFLKNLCLSNPFSHKEDYFKVDALSSMDKIGSLIWDEKHKVPYDVILTKTDISYGVYGLHTFYKMQLISKSLGEKLDEKQSCVLFTRWGRIGDTGNYQRTPFSNFKDARDEFCKIFRQKTGNDFVDTVLEKSKPFETKTRKYNLVKLESRQRPKLNDIKFDLFDTKQFTKESLFDKSIFRDRQEYAHFWQDLLNVSYLKSKVHLSNLSTDYLPLTQLSDDCLKKAYELLDKIRLLIEKRMELEKLSKKDHLFEYMSLIDQVTKLSNQYYELIPQMNFNYEKLTPISNEKDLDTQTSLLNQLTHSQVSCRILMGAKHSMTSSDSPIQNPFDYIYKCLNCKLELMEAQDVHTQFILRYIESTRSANVKIRSVFKFKRLDEKNNLDQYSNRYLLWHGTSTENLVSIMSRGLVISPSDSRLNGNRYGKGIYFSDSFAFSAGFSNGVRCIKETDTYTRCYALLCEVGIGKVKELRTSFETLDSLPKVFDSVKALGQMEPDPSKQVIMANGSVMPLGNMVPVELKPGEYIYSRGSRESQYVVYNEKQCSIRYIVQFDSYC